MDVTDNIGLIGSGLYPDICSLHDYARGEANSYLKEQYTPINVKKLSKTVGLYQGLQCLNFYEHSYLLFLDKENG